MRRAIREFVANARGATAIEYCLIVALMSLVIIGAVTATGTSLFNTMQNTATNISAASK